MDDELRKIMECTCLRMRRATRLVTQLYDHALGPSGLISSARAGRRRTPHQSGQSPSGWGWTPPPLTAISSR